MAMRLPMDSPQENPLYLRDLPEEERRRLVGALLKRFLLEQEARKAMAEHEKKLILQKMMAHREKNAALPPGMKPQHLSALIGAGLGGLTGLVGARATESKDEGYGSKLLKRLGLGAAGLAGGAMLGGAFPAARIMHQEGAGMKALKNPVLRNILWEDAKTAPIEAAKQLPGWLKGMFISHPKVGAEKQAGFDLRGRLADPRFWKDIPERAAVLGRAALSTAKEHPITTLALPALAGTYFGRPKTETDDKGNETSTGPRVGRGIAAAALTNLLLSPMLGRVGISGVIDAVRRKPGGIKIQGGEVHIPPKHVTRGTGVTIPLSDSREIIPRKTASSEEPYIHQFPLRERALKEWNPKTILQDVSSGEPRDVSPEEYTRLRSEGLHPISTILGAILGGSGGAAVGGKLLPTGSKLQAPLALAGMAGGGILGHMLQNMRMKSKARGEMEEFQMKFPEFMRKEMESIPPEHLEAILAQNPMQRLTDDVPYQTTTEHLRRGLPKVPARPMLKHEF